MPLFICRLMTKKGGVAEYVYRNALEGSIYQKIFRKHFDSDEKVQ